MAILSCFPAGGGAKLNVKAYAAVGNLPASDMEGAIAMITSTAIGDVYASADAPVSPASGDVWAWLGGESLAPVVLGDEITLHPRAVYQWSGSAWVLRESYVYTGSAWVEVTLYVYDNGAEILATISKHSASDANCYITKESARILVRLYTTLDYKYMWVSTDNAIDLTDVSTIRFKISGTINTQLGGIGSVRNSHAAYVALTGDNTLDVSAYSGLYYINFYYYIPNSGGTQTGYINEIELERQ